MELAIQVRIEELPEGLYLATSDELPGLVAPGRTVAEALNIARDVARKIMDARREREGPISLASVCHGEQLARLSYSTEKRFCFQAPGASPWNFKGAALGY